MTWSRRRPVDPMDPTANRARADKIAMGALGLLDALVRLATAWVLLKIRHRGPGLWWSAICVTLAVGVFYDPISGLAPGGLASVPGTGVAASTAAIMPATWGLLFLALELLILFRAFDQGRPGWLWWLIPLFAALGQLGHVVPDGAGGPGRGRRRPLARRRRGGVAGGIGEADGPIGKPGDGAKADEIAPAAAARPPGARAAWPSWSWASASRPAWPTPGHTARTSWPSAPSSSLIRPTASIRFVETALLLQRAGPAGLGGDAYL